MRIKICRKEAKETQFWLQLILPNPDQEVERQWLQQECLQLIRILGTIFKNATTG